ncbi:hypothetical protein K402DRAFT_1755 [Aulographum hederae CBS 113979]|uniref:Uncharacterized protein n=1 Tax=Aulographum hederae CBS 113979 TaxID=1176131 RepID=A0A6G1HG89_9PEZI|nr:hypothetical protein K402DRAFT_1755 [Aulographum hederae CBS 113979]
MIPNFCRMIGEEEDTQSESFSRSRRGKLRTLKVVLWFYDSHLGRRQEDPATQLIDERQKLIEPLWESWMCLASWASNAHRDSSLAVETLRFSFSYDMLDMWKCVEDHSWSIRHEIDDPRRSLPTLKCVRTLFVSGEYDMPWPGAIMDMTASLPTLKNLEIGVRSGGTEGKNVELRGRRRAGFIDLFDSLQRRLTNANIWIDDHPEDSSLSDAFNRTNPKFDIDVKLADSLSRSLRQMSYGLTTLRIATTLRVIIQQRSFGLRRTTDTNPHHSGQIWRSWKSSQHWTRLTDGF